MPVKQAVTAAHGKKVFVYIWAVLRIKRRLEDVQLASCRPKRADVRLRLPDAAGSARSL